jgi:hypothetical protein
MLLLLNSLSAVGWEWQRGCMEKYRLVKNIPADMLTANGYFDTEFLFPKGYFEYQEAVSRPAVIDKVRAMSSPNVNPIKT